MRLFAVGLLISWLVPAVAAAQRPDDPEREAVRQVIVRLGEFFQAEDVDAAEALFPERGIHILTDDGTTHAWAEYRDLYLLDELKEIEGLGYTHTRVEPTVRGNVSWVSFRREFSASGVPPFEGRGTAVLEKLDDRWMIVHMHLSR